MGLLRVKRFATSSYWPCNGQAKPHFTSLFHADELVWSDFNNTILRRGSHA